MSDKKPQPSEHQEQVAVVKWLTLHHIDFFAVPNGAAFRSKIQAAKLKREGLTPGVADLIVTDPPSEAHTAAVVALEMKRRSGAGPSAIQRSWLNRHANKAGWICLVGYGAEDAINKLKALGYGADK